MILELGAAAFCASFSGAVSRYYWLKPELPFSGLKILANGSMIGIAMQISAFACGTIAARISNDKKVQDFCIGLGYIIGAAGSVPVAVALAGKFNFKLSYQEAATTAALTCTTTLFNTSLVALGFIAVCWSLPGAISRYYWIRPEMSQEGLKILAKGGLVGLAIEITVLVVRANLDKIPPALPQNYSDEDWYWRFCERYTVGMVVIVPAAVAVARRFNFKLSYQEAATTAALYWAIHMAGKPS